MFYCYCLHAKSRRRVKLGVANNIATRMKQLEPEHGPLLLIHFWDFGSRPEAFHFEKAIHWHYRRQRLTRRDFVLAGEPNQESTECFTEDVLATVQELDLKAVRAAYKDSQLVEIRLPKALARLDIEAILEAAAKAECANAEPHGT